MNRFLSVILIVSLLFCLTGCGYVGSSVNEPVSFYYPRSASSYVYGKSDGVIVPETRETPGHSGDLHYLLTLYFHGPMDEALISPFPIGTNAEQITRDNATLNIHLNSRASVLNSSKLTVACACLAKTCMALTDAQTVVITADGLDSFSISFTRDSILLLDDELSPTE